MDLIGFGRIWVDSGWILDRFWVEFVWILGGSWWILMDLDGLGGFRVDSG